ncbi:TPA: UPF0175 family protein [Candidatus Woesearchaeota archaeon]|nr:UPF0175 family protein [Candidatus Woesearchaeota archaeon]HIG93967.1 UPF0175 family protein [Candidatus Woesearchaeota archaeon]HIH12180.1 UPF0175 family protein [Candidatus Woesearchaeota archaeon]
MTLTVVIPEDIVQALKIPPKEQMQELDKELALSLYQREALSLGKARKLAGLSTWDFLSELKKRKISRHYTTEELQEDLVYARKSRK